MYKLLAICAAISVLWITMTGCSAVRTAHIPESAASYRDAHEMLNSVLWMQTSAEYQILTRTAYTQAQSGMDTALADSTWTAALEQTDAYASLPPAVIVDIDETVLNNSCFDGRLVIDRSGFTESVWQQWTEKHMATAVPGADDFLKYAALKSVTVFYITNRDVSQEADTRINLANCNLPLRSDMDVILSRNENNWTSSDKGPRRAFVSNRFRVLVLVGDDLGDFVTGAKDTPENRVNLAETYSAFWGKRWILIPNPVYGSWESALYSHDFKMPDKALLKIKMDKVRGF